MWNLPSAEVIKIKSPCLLSDPPDLDNSCKSVGKRSELSSASFEHSLLETFQENSWWSSLEGLNIDMGLRNEYTHPVERTSSVVLHPTQVQASLWEFGLDGSIFNFIWKSRRATIDNGPKQSCLSLQHRHGQTNVTKECDACVLKRTACVLAWLRQWCHFFGLFPHHVYALSYISLFMLEFCCIVTTHRLLM